MKEFKRGDIIVDTTIAYNQTRYPILILRERENNFYCLDSRDFEPVIIGKDWIDQYAIVDSIDINKVIGFLKEE